MKTVTIGRKPDNNIIVNDSYASGYHCQISQYDNRSFRLLDRNSKNGTFVNGRQVIGEIILQPTDVIRIGNTTLPWQSYFAGGFGSDTIAGGTRGISNTGGTGARRPQKSYGFGITALVCGIVGLIGVIMTGPIRSSENELRITITVIGIISAVLAVIFGAICLGRKDNNKGLGIAGFIIGIVDIILGIILLIDYVIYK